MAETNRIEDLANATAFDVDGDKVGGVQDVYVNDTSGQPDFVSVNHGLFGAGTSIVPLRGHTPVSYTHLTLPTTLHECRSRWSPYH